MPRFFLPFLLIGSLVSSIAFCAVEEAADAFETQQLADHLYMISGAGGNGSNVGVYVGEEGLILVDAMLEKSSQGLLAAIQEVSEKPILYVLNTHSDADHSGGNAFFAEQGATIISQANARYSPAQNRVLFNDELIIELGGETVALHHVVSHSFSDVIISFSESNAVFMGDIYTTSWHPTFYSGGPAGQRAAIALAYRLGDAETKIVPGHGTVTGRDVLHAFSGNTDHIVARITAMAEDGVSVDGIVRDEEVNRLLSNFNVDGGSPFVPQGSFTRFVARTLSTERDRPNLKLDLSAYEGAYVFDDASAVRLEAAGDELFIYAEGDYMAQLIPQSATRFHVRGRLGDHFTFSRNDLGSVMSIGFVTAEGTLNGVRLEAAVR